MNTQLVNCLIHIIQALPAEERANLEKKLFFEAEYLSTNGIETLAIKGGSFNLLADKPDMHSMENGTYMNELNEQTK